MVNPLTTLATNIYNTEKKSDGTFTYKDAKKIIASNLGLDISQMCRSFEKQRYICKNSTNNTNYKIIF
jgi:hypothetical protein